MKVFGKIINILLFIFLLLLSYKVVEGKINREPPTMFGYRVYYVSTGSMEPTLKTGSIILVKKWTNQTELTPGDIITFRMPYNPNILITHRIKEIVYENGQAIYRTKGDANSIQDPWIINNDSIVSVYNGMTVPIVGYLYQLIHVNFVIYVLCILLGLILISYGLDLIRKSNKKSNIV